MKKNFGTFKTLTVAFFYTLLLFSLAVTFVLHFRSLYYFDMEYLKIAESSGYSSEVIRKNYDELIDYNTIGGPDELSFSDFPMSKEGKIHFEEVRTIFLLVQYAAIAAIPLLLLILFWQYRRKNQKFFLYCAGMPAVLTLSIGSFVCMNWDTAFVVFHKILFRNDYWLFHPDKDPIITILPDLYFFHAACAILLFIIFASVLCFILFCKLKSSSDKGKVSNNVTQ